MTDKEIVERAKKAEKRTGFGELVHSPISKGVNSAFGIGFIEGMVEYRNSMQEEFVSDDLKKSARKYAGIPEDSPHDLKYCVQDKKAKYDAVLYGANLQKQQMMKDALDAVVKIDAGGYPYVDATIELYDYVEDIPLAKEGDKYNVVLIKED